MSFNVEQGKELVRKHDRMTMLQLKRFVNDNNLFYQRVPRSKNLVAIYYDRYHNEKLGYILVKDYQPIKNFRTREFGFVGRNAILSILKKNAKMIPDIPGIMKPYIEITVSKEDEDEYKVIKAWLEE